jgi:hypothetical protein
VLSNGKSLAVTTAKHLKAERFKDNNIQKGRLPSVLSNGSHPVNANLALLKQCSFIFHLIFKNKFS